MRLGGLLFQRGHRRGAQFVEVGFEEMPGAGHDDQALRRGGKRHQPLDLRARAEFIPVALKVAAP